MFDYSFGSVDIPQLDAQKIISKLLTFKLTGQRIGYILVLDSKYPILTLQEWRKLYDLVNQNKNQQHKEQLWFAFKRQILSNNWKSQSSSDKQRLWKDALNMLDRSASTQETDILSLDEKVQHDFAKAKPASLLTDARLMILRITLRAMKCKHETQKISALIRFYKLIPEKLLTIAKVMDYISILVEENDPKILLEALQLLKTYLFSSNKQVEECYLPIVKKVFEKTVSHPLDDEICNVLIKIVANITKVNQANVINIALKALCFHNNTNVLKSLQQLCSRTYFRLLRDEAASELLIDAATVLTIVQKVILLLDWSELIQCINDIIGIKKTKIGTVISLRELHELIFTVIPPLIGFHIKHKDPEYCYKALDFLLKNWDEISRLQGNKNLIIGGLLLLAQTIGRYGSKENFEKFCNLLFIQYMKQTGETDKTLKEGFVMRRLTENIYQQRLSDNGLTLIFLPTQKKISSTLEVLPESMKLMETISRFFLCLSEQTYSDLNSKAYVADFMFYNLQHHIKYYPTLSGRIVSDLEKFIHFITPTDLDLFPIHTRKAIELIYFADELNMFGENREEIIRRYCTTLQKDTEALNNLLKPSGEKIMPKKILRMLSEEVTPDKVITIIENVNVWQQIATGNQYITRWHCLNGLFRVLKNIRPQDNAQKKTIYDKIVSVVLPTSRLFREEKIDPTELIAKRTCKECLIALSELTFVPEWNQTIHDQVEWLKEIFLLISQIFIKRFFLQDEGEYLDILKSFTGYVLKAIKGKPRGSEDLVTSFTELFVIELPKNLMQERLKQISCWRRLLPLAAPENDAELAKLAERVLLDNNF